MNRKTFLSIILFLVYPLLVSAQIIDSTIIGYYSDNTPVKATSVKYQETIHSFNITPSKQFIAANLRPFKNGKWGNYGEVGMIEISTGKLLWKEEINFAKENPQCTDYGILVTSLNGTKLLHRYSGRQVWEKDVFPIYHDVPSGILFTYNRTSERVRAIRTMNAEELWKGHKISPNYGWSEVQYLNDSTRLIVANGIYKLNLHTGEAKEYEVQTGVLDARENMIEGLIGIASAIGAGISAANLGYGVYWVPTFQNTITQFHSNLLKEDSLYYFANKKGISCLNTELQPIWEFELADGLCSKSQLQIKGDSLYMINYGYAVKDSGKRVKRGQPFFAIFNKRTGDLHNINHLTTEKEIMHDAAYFEENAYLLFEDGIAYQNPLHSKAQKKEWGNKEKGILQDIVNDTIYAYQITSQDFNPLTLSPKRCPVLTEKSEVVVFNDKLEILEEHNSSVLYRPISKNGTIICIKGIKENETDCWIIHESGKPLLHISKPINDVKAISNDMLILLNYNQLFFLSIKDILSNQHSLHS